jgi:TIR domain
VRTTCSTFWSRSSQSGRHYRTAWSALRRVGQSFLFVGFGIRHWYLRVLLKVLVRALELHRTGSAIATEPLRGLSDVDREQTILYYQRGTRIELEDADIGAFLAELAVRLAAEGGFAEHAAPIGPRPRVFISYAREDGDLAAMVFDALQKENFEPWFDKEALTGGERWDDRITDALDASDFALVLYTPALCRKADSYVNKEVNLARRRALNVRGPFLIPLRTQDIAVEHRIAELGEYQEMLVRPACFDEDMSAVISSMRRDFQRRYR